MTDEELLENIKWHVNFPSRNCDIDNNEQLWKVLENAINCLSAEGGNKRECGNIEPAQRRERCWRSWNHEGYCRAGQWASWDPVTSGTHMLHHDTKKKQAEFWFKHNKLRLDELRKLEAEAQEHQKALDE